jgi:hypothetical protein
MKFTGKIETHVLSSMNVYPQILSVMRKDDRTKQATDGNMAHVRCMMGA